MKALLISVFLLFAVSFLKPAYSATFNVTDSTGFQAALTSASTNNEDNTINLAAGTYSSTSGFTYSAIRHTLTIVGANVDATDDATVITSSSGTGITFTFSGTIQVSGITVQDCAATGLLFENASDDPAVATFNVSIQDSHFTGNGASGVIVDDQLFVGPVEVKNSVFDHNTHSSDGGGLYVYVANQNSPVTLTGNSFDQNHSDGTGGGAWLKTLSIEGTDMTVGSSVEGEGNSFTSNTAETSSAGIFIATYCNMSFVGNTLIGNTIPIDISHFGATGGGVIIQYAGTGEFSNNVIQNNSAPSSGGFGVGTFLEGSIGTINMNANLISGNSSEDYGGGSIAMAVLSAPIVVTNNIIVDNSVTGPSSTVGGLNIAIPPYATSVQEIEVINNTFVQNNAELYFTGALAITSEKAGIVANLYNNIFWENSLGSETGQDVYVYYTAWEGMNLLNNNVSEVCVSDGILLSCAGPDDPFFQDYNTISGMLSSSNNLFEDPVFFATGDLVDQYSLAANSPMIQVGDPSAPQLPEFDYTGTVPMDTPNPDLGALQYCVPNLSITITPNSETIVLGENVTWTVALIDSAHCASNNNTLTLSFTNSEFQSGSLTSASLSRQLISAFAAASVVCTGSGSSASCTISQIAADSTVNVNIVGNTLALGTVGLSASLSNSLATASASGSGTAIVVAGPGPGPSPDSLSGAGCSLSKSPSESHLSFWMFSWVILLPLIKKAHFYS